MNSNYRAGVFLRRVVCMVFFAGVLSSLSYAQTIGGIGAMLRIDSADDLRMPQIMSILPNSPAAASLKEKQFILKVNDVSCANKTIEEVVGMIRGVVGTHVKVSVADNKKGKHVTEYDLMRAAIQTGDNNASQADPVTAFNTDCEMKIKQLRKTEHVTIVKTFNSDCGNFFFNFNTDGGLYKVRLYAMTDKGGASDDVSALVFDGNDEAGGQKFLKGVSQDIGNLSVCQWNGEVTFKRAGVGVVSTKIRPGADVTKCKAMYIVVYK